MLNGNSLKRLVVLFNTEIKMQLGQKTHICDVFKTKA